MAVRNPPLWRVVKFAVWHFGRGDWLRGMAAGLPVLKLSTRESAEAYRRAYGLFLPGEKSPHDADPVLRDFCRGEVREAPL